MKQRLRVWRLSRELDRLASMARGRRFERPVLRGDVLDGNGAAAAERAIAALGPLPPLGELGPALRVGRPLPSEVVDLVRVHGSGLRALRDASRRGWAHWDPDYTSGQDRPVPPFPAHLKASKLLLAQAILSPPGECLRICADVVRLAGDLTPQMDLVGHATATVSIDLAAPVALRCASRATRVERAASAREFEVLAASPPSFGETLWVDQLLGVANLRATERGLPWSPISPGGRAAFEQRALLLDAWEYLLHELARPIVLRATEYPDSFPVLEDLMDRRRTSGPPVVAATAGSFTRHLHRDAAAQVQVRAVALALAVLADLPPGGALPPALSASLTGRRALSDPFQGTPLRWRLAPDGATATIYSVGPDGADDGAAEGSDDVALTLPR